MKYNILNEGAQFFKETKVELWTQANNASKKGNLLTRLAAPLFATGAGLITLAENVTFVAEVAIKGVANAFGSLSSTDFNLMVGITELASLPFVAAIFAIKLVFLLPVQFVTNTAGMVFAPETYSAKSKKISEDASGESFDIASKLAAIQAQTAV